MDICRFLDIDYPIIQAGMVWVSGGKLAAAAANAGCLGVIGAGSMAPLVLKEHLVKAKLLAPQKNLAINLPLLYDKIEEQISIALEQGIKVFITSAGSPKKYTSFLKSKGAIVIHVCASPVMAKKCEQAGVDLIIAEGYEAGGHNGKEELTTMTLIPQVCDAVSIPVIAAGGIGDGRQMAAAFCLGAIAVQMGTRFMMTKESSAHDFYKEALVHAAHDSTQLTMKQVVPVRLLKNEFFKRVIALEESSLTPIEMKTQLIQLLGKGRARKGMLEGDLVEGELEVGQVVGMLNDLPSVSQCVQTILKQYAETIKGLSARQFSSINQGEN